MTLPSGKWRLGFDIGGTFTDFVLHEGTTGALTLHKRLTTPQDPSEAALAGLDEILAMQGIGPGDLSEIIHGTTLVTNAVIERTGARTGLIATEGFGDILEMGTEQRYDIYDLFLPFPEPLVPRDLRLEVPERIDASGRVLAGLDEAALERAGA
ncbi:methylhydantoinase, partial [Rhodovulum sulfidophilum]|nr:methylhydantoinase [Rhodovulum sulfidophilum]